MNDFNDITMQFARVLYNMIKDISETDQDNIRNELTKVSLDKVFLMALSIKKQFLADEKRIKESEKLLLQKHTELHERADKENDIFAEKASMLFNKITKVDGD